ncbi:diguanylate cyclase domain-containing protein [Litchfieldia alkalitelluris]|nr:diguanylate cyclase [Litchfieldia alkalitelluris]
MCSRGGISYYPDDQDSKTLMKHADLAMYKAKEKGKNTYHVF